MVLRENARALGVI